VGLLTLLVAMRRFWHFKSPHPPVGEFLAQFSRLLQRLLDPSEKTF
jgi:hypothetical protein